MRRAKKWITPIRRWSIHLRDRMRCTYCEAPANEILQDIDNFLTLDHILPICKGGWHQSRNLVTACWRCNEIKGRRLLRDAAPLLDSNYNTLFLRVQRRRRKDMALYREAALVLLGKLPGIPRAVVVIQNGQNSRLLWQSGAVAVAMRRELEWALQQEEICLQCHRPFEDHVESERLPF